MPDWQLNQPKEPTFTTISDLVGVQLWIFFISVTHLVVKLPLWAELTFYFGFINFLTPTKVKNIMSPFQSFKKKATLK